MLPNEKGVLSEIISRDLHWQAHTLANVFNKLPSCPVVALAHFVRNDQLCVCVDARPQPKIAAFLFWRDHSARVTADILPLFVHFDAKTRQVSKISVGVTRERFAGFTNDSGDHFLLCPEHARNRSNWCSFTERRED